MRGGRPRLERPAVNGRHCTRHRGLMDGTGDESAGAPGASEITLNL
jgi:hypothetical protein